MKLRYFAPLAGFVVPTLVISCFVIPGSPIAGVNEHTIGFALTVLGACLTYMAGVRMVVRDRGRSAR